MTIVDEWRAWQVVCAAVEDRDVASGRRPAPPDDELCSPSPLLAACEAASLVTEGLVFNGGHWQGRWIPNLRRRA